MQKPLDSWLETLRLHVGVVTLAPNPRICTFALVGDGAKAKVLGQPLTRREEFMATTASKKTAAPAAKKAAAPATKKSATASKKTAPVAKKAAAPVVKNPVAATPLKPIKDTFTKASLTIHLAERSGVEPKAAKALLAALEETVLASIHKKGAKEFTLPGLLKVVAQDVPAKKKRFGKDPFSGEDKWFAAKPASVRLKVRPLKKLKDAAL
jgi:nucleoid DNA-binding protein